MDGAQKSLPEASRSLTFLHTRDSLGDSAASGSEDCWQTTARHNPLVTMDTLACSEQILPQAVAPAL